MLHLQVVISITLLVTKEHLLMMQDYSTAHTFHYRWFVLWEKTPSSQKLDLRQDTVLLQTHLLKEPHRDLVDYLLTKTDTTEEWLLKTLCKQDAYISFKTLLREGLFLWLQTMITYAIISLSHTTLLLGSVLVYTQR